ncbi:MAG: serpin family protein [Candidatus Neomarinimicrobiota bacterium]
MKKIVISCLMILLILSSSCSKKELINDTTFPPEMSAENIVGGLNDFSFDLYHALNSGGSVNEFYSALSISAAFAMTYAGAKNETANEMSDVLNYGPQNKHFHALYGKMLDSLSQKTEDFEINIANAIWLEENFKLLKKYQKIVSEDYRSESQLLDFVNAAEASRKVINNWVEYQTNNKIKDLIPEGVLDADTRMVLTNAVYFNAEWANMFNEKMSKKDIFHLLDGSETTCDMMYQRHHYPYSKTSSHAILEIPYKGYDYSMLIVLPRTNQGLKQEAKTLSSAALKQHDKNKTSEDVLLYMPKFKLESNYQLASILKRMGLKEAFSANADFSGISGNKDLYISDAIHKAFIEVDEKKTEAAAATGLVMKLTSMAPVHKAPLEFRADHPFTFMIRHNKTKAIIFMGQLTEPEIQ